MRLSSSLRPRRSTIERARARGRGPLGVALTFAIIACGPIVAPTVERIAPPKPTATARAEAPPVTRLPTDTRPTRYSIALRVDPSRPRFEGAIDITVELDRARDVLWLHGKDLVVRSATIRPETIGGRLPPDTPESPQRAREARPLPEAGPAIDARWEPMNASGLAALRVASPIGPGRAVVHVEYDAAFGGNDEGVFVRESGGDRYVFTQLEAAYGRRVFPCFDEPSFKVPFDLALTVPHGLAAISNTHEVARGEGDDAAWDRVTFATTEPLPTYLLAFAVGPLDVMRTEPVPPNAVRHRPLPLRMVATRGRAAEMGYALKHTGELVAALERYFGSEFPYEKLDLIAVPEKGGAMENAGAITFAEGIVLLDDNRATADQRFHFDATVGHEIAHQWFGDLVTMEWWDDLWLNEAFATWIEEHVIAEVDPALHPEIRALQAVHSAMSADSLTSARKIRQEIADDQDIESAFDVITYDKGAAVLSMFERWIGPEAFQKGIRAHLAAHRFGTATASDLLAALSTAAGRDVGTAFRTFLDQPGLPFVEASVVCDGKPRIALRQSRFLPIGSLGARDDRAWQIPVCARYPDATRGAVREACTLLATREGEIALDTAACPAWVMPNADAAGYYRWSLAPADGKKLATFGLGSLRERERVSFARSITAGFARGSVQVADVLEALAPLATDPSQAVASVPMEIVSMLGRWLEGDPLHERLRAYAAARYAPVYRSLGWAPKKAGEAEDATRIALRRSVLDFLAHTAHVKEVRREAAARGRAYLGLGKDGVMHVDAAAPELLAIALEVAAEDGGARVFDALVAVLATERREVERGRILNAIGSAIAPDLAARARELELDPRVRANEVSRILGMQLRRPETRETAWAWLAANVDKILARMSGPWASAILWQGSSYCDRAHRNELEKLFAPRAPSIEGGPRALAGALEEMSLCIARREAEEPSARAFFARKGR